MKEEKLSVQQIDALLLRLNVKDAEFDDVKPVKREVPQDLRVSTDQRDWDYLMKLPKAEFKQIIWRRELDKAEQVILVLRRDHDLIMTYLAERVFTSDKALLELAKGQNLEEIKAAMVRTALPDEAICYLFEKGFKDVREYLVTRGCLGLAGELAMMKRGSHHDIMIYLRHWPMYPATARELIKRGNHDEIMACIKHKNAIFGANLRLLIERGNRQEVERCLALCYPSVKIPE